jgi:hypothetical protein
LTFLNETLATHFRRFQLLLIREKLFLQKISKKQKKSVASVAMTFKRSNTKGLNRNTFKNKSVAKRLKVLQIDKKCCILHHKPKYS